MGRERRGRHALALVLTSSLSIAIGACTHLDPEHAPHDVASRDEAPIASSSESGERAVAERDGDARETRWPFSIGATKRDDVGIAETHYIVPFGPVDGAVATYDTTDHGRGGARPFVWSGNADVMEVVVGTEHLRRVRLRASELARIDLERGVIDGRPDLEEERWPLDDQDIVWTAFRERAAPRVGFEETAESFSWEGVRASRFFRGQRTLRGHVVGRDGQPPVGFVVRVGLV